MKLSKRAIIFGCALVILIIAAIIIFVRRRAVPKVPEEEIHERITFLEANPDIKLAFEESQTPVVPEPLKITEVIDDRVSFPSLSLEERGIFYFSLTGGRLYRTQLDTKEKRELFPLARFENMDSVIWSPLFNRAIISYRSFPKEYLLDDLEYLEMPVTKEVLDFSSQSSVRLNKNIEDVMWTPSGDRIVYHYLDEEQDLSVISIADHDGGNWRNLKELTITPYSKVLRLVKCYSNRVLFVSFSDDGSEFTLYSLDLFSGEQTRIIDKIRWAKPSPDGRSILVEAMENGNLIHFVMDLDRRTREILDIDTLINKCVWSNDNTTIYYALGDNVNYLVSDSFWKLNTVTGQKTQLTNLDLDSPIDASDLFLSQDEKTLFFKNNIDGKLYSLALY